MKRPTKINVMVSGVGGGGIGESVMKALRMLKENFSNEDDFDIIIRMEGITAEMA